MFDLERFAEIGSDVTAYFWLAVFATLVYLVKFGLDLFGADSDAASDPSDLDADLDTDASFALVSVLSVLAFLMGCGWMGLAARAGWGLGATLSALAAVGFGTAMMFLSAGLMFWARGMTHVARYNVKTAVGTTGKVYLTVPAKGEGRGQIEVVVSGRRKVMDAVSASAAIPAFSPARVVRVRDDDVFVVERAEGGGKGSARARRWGR